MLDLERLHRIRLSNRPLFQRVVAHTFLKPNYEFPPRVSIEFEGEENVPHEPVIFAMNHTDRYNYWPFQYTWWRRRDRFTATWVKGKYYENRYVGLFMEMTNNIPTVSRGYLITKDFVRTLRRRPSDEEYSQLRDWVDRLAAGEELEPPTDVPRKLTGEPRDILGRFFDPQRETYAQAINSLFRSMMERFVRLNEDALQIGLDLLVFPQGTRSKRLSRGHIGLAQIAMHLECPVVPVGCNGTDHVYPTGSPLAKEGRVVYRFGRPIPFSASPDRPRSGTFRPFTPEAEREHREAFQRYVDVVMDGIDSLLDPEYRYSEDRESRGVAGSTRFV